MNRVKYISEDGYLIAILFAIVVRCFMAVAVCFRVTIIDANIDNNVFRNFLIFILSFQH